MDDICNATWEYCEELGIVHEITGNFPVLREWSLDTQ